MILCLFLKMSDTKYGLGENGFDSHVFWKDVMGNKYHYDRHGNYRGMTSDDPPSDNSGCVFAVVVIVLICILSGGC